MDRTDRILIVLIVIALGAAIWLAAGRARIEAANRTVEIVVDCDDARLVAASAGKPLAAYLGELREAGASALAIRERTVGDLEQQGQLLAISRSDTTSLLALDAGFAAAVTPALSERLPQARVALATDPRVIDVRMPVESLPNVPVFLDPGSVAAARAAGMAVVARPINFPGATRAAVGAAIEQAARAGAKLIVFDKEEALGYDGLLHATAAGMRESEMLLGLVEMADQRGVGTLAQALPGQVVRVHSISENDMLTATPATAVPRYARAVQERNIRVVYVRLITRPEDDLAAYNVSYIRSVASAIRADGFDLGAAKPFSAPRGWPPRWPRALAALGVLAGSVLLLRRFVPLPAGRAWAVLGAALVLGPAAAFASTSGATRLAGLGAAVVFPTLGVFWALQAQPKRGGRWGFGTVFGTAVGRLVGASAISLVGGLLIVGLYSRAPYLSAIGAFSGVKMALVVPLALILVAVAANLSGRIEPLGQWYPRVKLRTSQFLGAPVSVLTAGVVVVGLAAIGLALTRSGNQPVLSPSGIELKFRSFLEAVLAVRPRTKEFLLGYPALMLGVALAMRGRRVWMPLVGVAAVLGQVSLVNTLCHFHTPLAISLTRIVNGLWLGALIGALLTLGWWLIVDRRTSEL